MAGDRRLAMTSYELTFHNYEGRRRYHRLRGIAVTKAPRYRRGHMMVSDDKTSRAKDVHAFFFQPQQSKNGGKWGNTFTTDP